MAFWDVTEVEDYHYKKVVEIRLPTRFYWNKDGSFAGISIGGANDELESWQNDIAQKCLNVISSLIVRSKERKQ